MTFALAAAAMPAAAPRYTVERLADGVHAVIFDPEVETEGNTLVIVNDDDVVVVDSNAGITTAKMTIAEIRKLTAKPVRFVVNTHWHDDHVMGNQAYADAYPGVQFVAHPLTRQDIVEHAFANTPYVMDIIAADIERLAGYLRTGIGRDGKPLTPEMRTRVQAGHDKRVEILADRRQFVAVPPTVDVGDSLTLKRGTREIEIRYLGRGNTRGDLVVYLPRERIVATGDLVVAPIPFATNAYAGEWVKTLDRLMALPATTVLPGHGPVMKDWSYVRRVKGALEATLAAVAAAKREGLTVTQTIERVQLPEVRDGFLAGVEARRAGYEAFFRTSLVRNAWEELDPAVMEAYERTRLAPVADGIYRYGDATAVINQKDVVLLHGGGTAAAARATVRALRERTDKAVRFIVVTGNGGDAAAAALDTYREAYPQADVVAERDGKPHIAVGGVMTLHREGREIRIRRQAPGGLVVDLPIEKGSERRN